jgi:hypothetical protein
MFMTALSLLMLASPLLSFSPPNSLLSMTRYSTRTKPHAHNTKNDEKWSTPPDVSNQNKSTDNHKSNIFSKAYHLYIDYFDKLWAETDVTRRKKVEKQKAIEAVLRVKDLMGEDTNYFEVQDDVKVQVTNACNLLLNELDVPKKQDDNRKVKVKVMGEVDISPPAQKVNGAESSFQREDSTELIAALVGDLPDTITAVAITPNASMKKKEKKKGRSVLFGATMGLIVAGWVYSGNYIFTTLFTLMTALGQLEYYRMVMNTGIYPARRISVLGACATFVTALFAPDLHQICLPLFSTFAMIWFLTKRTGGTSISEIATTFTGMFYLGYVPSYWVR